MQVTTVGSLTLVGNQRPELIKRVMGNLEEGRIAFVQGILKRASPPGYACWSSARLSGPLQKHLGDFSQHEGVVYVDAIL